MPHHHLPVNADTVHWGYFSKVVKPALVLRSGDSATIETLTHHAANDYERMVEGDPGAESVYRWTREHKAVARRGAGPTAGFVKGSGEGLGVHLLTGPVAIEGAEPGDILEVRVLDVRPRPSCSPRHAGRCFGSQRRGVLGLSLSRSDRGAETARGGDDLRARHVGRPLRESASTITSGRRRPTLTASCIA